MNANDRIKLAMTLGDHARVVGRTGAEAGLGGAAGFGGMVGTQLLLKQILGHVPRTPALATALGILPGVGAVAGGMHGYEQAKLNAQARHSIVNRIRDYFSR